MTRVSPPTSRRCCRAEVAAAAVVCGCAPKLALYARAEDVPRVAGLMQRRWQELALREGTVGEDSVFVRGASGAGEVACPACGTAAPLANGACTDCGLQLE